jgi:8-oxo-dGTP pyrophosphatase MutT (NUDIX family)
VNEAVVAVLRDADRFLVILRGASVTRPGYWTPLSGRIERGESQAEALVREVREEVGLEVTPLAKVWECPTDDGRYRLHWWTAEITGGALAPDGVEVEDARWVTPEEFAELAPTFAADHEFVERILPTLDPA